MMLKRIARTILPKPAKNYLKNYLRKHLIPETYSLRFPTIGTEIPSPYPLSINSDNPLCELGKHHNPTKRGHNYLPYYWLYFRDIRERVRKILEIGVQTDRSLRMWEDFFPNAEIYGIDVDRACKQFESTRRKIFIGDQSDPDFLNEVIQKTGRALDIVVDDGSHRADHQLRSFDYLFPALTDHGIYVIEDVGLGDQEHQVLNTMKKIIDHINYWPPGFPTGSWPHLSSFPDTASWIDKHVTGIVFYRFIIFIFKGRNPEDNPYLRPN